MALRRARLPAADRPTIAEKLTEPRNERCVAQSKGAHEKAARGRGYPPAFPARIT